MLIIYNLIYLVVYRLSFIKTRVKLFCSIQIASKPVLKVLQGKLELLLILLYLFLKLLIFIQFPNVSLSFSEVSWYDSLRILSELSIDLVI